MSYWQQLPGRKVSMNGENAPDNEQFCRLFYTLESKEEA